jgi:cell division protease FtsH
MRPPVWALGVILLAAALFGIVDMVDQPPTMSYSDFLDQLDAGNVAGVTIKGTQIDGSFKHAVGQAAPIGTASQTVFHSQVPDFGDPALMPELRKEHVAIDVVSSSSWTRLLGGLPLPMLLMLGAIVIAGIVKLLRGGKSQLGSNFPMHPMQGMVGLVSGLFSTKDQVGTPPCNDQTPPKA